VNAVVITGPGSFKLLFDEKEEVVLNFSPAGGKDAKTGKDG
jgi:hypothetical protein